MALLNFSRIRREVQDIVIAVMALTFAFTISSFSRNGFRMPASYALYILGVSFAAVCLAFLMHELAHRQVARRFGGYAEFKLWPLGLIGGVILSFLGFVIAAPGAVYMGGIFGNERIGKTALAGPATNLVIGIAFLAAGVAISTVTLLGSTFIYLSQINFYLGAFNMVPFPPLDGQKVMSWNIRIFILSFASAIFLAVLSFVIFS